ncbi:MAG: Gfo/Idh/MocA family oxidoreductase [Lentisphaerae bacterium]|nr:Gfo/Idh/MocA family oxidoreductase [Lentisphaerota bacterium]
MDQVRVGIAGAGGMGRSHAQCLARLDGASVVGAADPYAASLEKLKAGGHMTNDAVYCASLNELLQAASLDALIIAAPDDLHLELIETAMQAGVHILCEKPIVHNRSGLDRLARLVAGYDKTFQVGLESRHLPVHKAIRRTLDDGALGQPRLLWCKEFRGPFLEKPGNWILNQARTGGTFVEKMCHYFDLLTWFAGARPVKVMASAAQDVLFDLYGATPDIIDNGIVLIEYGNGARATVMVCMFMPAGPSLELGILGDKGRLESVDPFVHSAFEFWSVDGQTHESRTEAPPDDVHRTSHAGGVFYEDAAFIEAIRNGTPGYPGFAIARDSVLVGLAAEESARNGGAAVRIEP